MPQVFTGTGFPPWATLSPNGLLTILDTAPAGSAVVTVTLTDTGSGFTYSKPITLIVNPKTVVAQFFSLATPNQADLSVTVSLGVTVYHNIVALLQSPSINIAVSIQLTQELIPGETPATDLSSLNIAVSITTVQNYVPYSSGGS